jgi:hypothetical protein
MMVGSSAPLAQTMNAVLRDRSNRDVYLKVLGAFEQDR